MYVTWKQKITLPLRYTHFLWDKRQLECCENQQFPWLWEYILQSKVETLLTLNIVLITISSGKLPKQIILPTLFVFGQLRQSATECGIFPPERHDVTSNNLVMQLNVDKLGGKTLNLGSLIFWWAKVKTVLLPTINNICKF